jgi:hypothetical protein
MKKYLLFGAAFLFIAWAATSCKELTGCQTCKIVTRNISDDSLVTSDSGTEYCDDELTAFKEANPRITNTVLGIYTQVECN